MTCVCRKAQRGGWREARILFIHPPIHSLTLLLSFCAPGLRTGDLGMEPRL